MVLSAQMSDEAGAAVSVWRGRTERARDRSAPLRAFLQTESGSAGILLAAVVAALIWANIDVGSYERAWHNSFSIRVGDIGITRDLRTWINSGLMTLFFLVVGLEARREFDLGDLRERRRFILPCLAGLVGMVVPVLIYLAVNAGHSSAHGWGVAMSTDTALALGLLALLGRNVPDRVRAFLLTVFVVDDLAALIVIAVVYSDHIDAMHVGMALAVFVALLVATALRMQQRWVYVVIGVVMWAALLASGVDPIVAGLVIGLSASAYAPGAHRPRRGHGAGPAVPRAADLGTGADGHCRPDVDAVAERAAAILLPPVDELPDRAAVRPGQRRYRAQRAAFCGTRTRRRSRSGFSSATSSASPLP